MKVSDYIVSYLEKKGVKVIFGYIGGMITHLVDSISLNPNMQFVQTYHEQTAAIAAEGFAKESGLFGVAISTSGPGATNMMTGIADAYFDSIPVLYITGQVNTYEYKYDKPVRQQGFQETDVVSMVKPVTKYAKLVDKAEDIKYELDKALHIALSGRMGPVLLELPMDIQRADINIGELGGFISDEKSIFIPDLDEVVQLIEKSRRPMLLLGAGCMTDSIKPLLADFLYASHIPVVTSLMGRGAIDETYQNYIGMIGSYGNRCANMAVANADLLIALGTRLDTRQTGAQIDTFLTGNRIIHVDIDVDELNCHRLPNRLTVNQDVYSFVKQLLSLNIKYNEDKFWVPYLLGLKQNYNQNNEIERFVENKSPYRMIQILNEYTKEGDIICADIGQNQMWTAQTLQLKSGQRFLTSGGLAPMGFSLPVSIGASFANPNKTVYSLNGDGGFHMAIQSLMLISQYNLPIKVIVLNNQALGMITQFQHLYFNDRMAGTTIRGGYMVPDIKSVAASYGLL
ncbi:MAG: thiamine pyrophosphate-binding protein, partial [Bacteroides oleiciplenus]|nr:thiamine pyrophosphate-binding protein [Bacteroides oleiciplenus]